MLWCSMSLDRRLDQQESQLFPNVYMARTTHGLTPTSPPLVLVAIARQYLWELPRRSSRQNARANHAKGLPFDICKEPHQRTAGCLLHCRPHDLLARAEDL